jgi:hypothetical protein
VPLQFGLQPRKLKPTAPAPSSKPEAADHALGLVMLFIGP